MKTWSDFRLLIDVLVVAFFNVVILCCVKTTQYTLSVWFNQVNSLVSGQHMSACVLLLFIVGYCLKGFNSLAPLLSLGTTRHPPCCEGTASDFLHSLSIHGCCVLIQPLGLRIHLVWCWKDTSCVSERVVRRQQLWGCTPCYLCNIGTRFTVCSIKAMNCIINITVVCNGSYGFYIFYLKLFCLVLSVSWMFYMLDVCTVKPFPEIDNKADLI